MTPDEQAIRDVIAQWINASATGDVGTMLTLLADDMLFVVPGAPPFGKQDFKSTWEGPMKGAKVKADATVEEVLISGDFGVTRTRVRVEITTADGNSSSARGYTMSLFRKQPDGRWLLARDANLLTPEP
jgi:uncharacterized protein (TIGR02246 family)